MPAYTSPDNIQYPVSTDQVAPLETVFANMAQSTQNAFDGFRIDWNDFEANRAIQTFRWADATARAAQTGMQAGDRGYQIDTGVDYSYNGTTWRMWSSPPIARTGTILNNVTVGAGGTLVSYVQYVNGMVHEFGKFTAGTGSSVTGAIELSTAVTMDTSLYQGHRIYVGGCVVEDVGSASNVGTVATVSTSRVGLYVDNASAAYGTQTAVSGSVPMTWSTVNGDTVSWDFRYLAA